MLLFRSAPLCIYAFLLVVCRSQSIRCVQDGSSSEEIYNGEYTESPTLTQRNNTVWIKQSCDSSASEYFIQVVYGTLRYTWAIANRRDPSYIPDTPYCYDPYHPIGGLGSFPADPAACSYGWYRFDAFTDTAISLTVTEGACPVQDGACDPTAAPTTEPTTTRPTTTRPTTTGPTTAEPTTLDPSTANPSTADPTSSPTVLPTTTPTTAVPTIVAPTTQTTETTTRTTAESETTPNNNRIVTVTAADSLSSTQMIAIANVTEVNALSWEIWVVASLGSFVVVCVCCVAAVRVGYAHRQRKKQNDDNAPPPPPPQIANIPGADGLAMVSVLSHSASQVVPVAVPAPGVSVADDNDPLPKQVGEQDVELEMTPRQKQAVSFVYDPNRNYKPEGARASLLITTPGVNRDEEKSDSEELYDRKKVTRTSDGDSDDDDDGDDGSSGGGGDVRGVRDTRTMSTGVSNEPKHAFNEEKQTAQL